jgi:fucose 4-O-acetylase-like acetyltransferase
MATAAYVGLTKTGPERDSTKAHRVAWIDIARGLGIVLVVYGHSLRGLVSGHQLSRANSIWASDYTIYTFHMPLFFLLAGLQVDRSIAKGRWPFLRSKLVTIAYPYVLWSLFQTGMQLLLPGVVNTPHATWTLWVILWRPIAQFWFLYVLCLCHFLAFVTRAQRSLLIPLTFLCVAGAVAANYGVPASLAIPASLAHWFIFYAAGIFFSSVLLNWKPSAGVAAFATVISAIAFGLFSHFGRAWSGGNSDAPASWPSAATGIALLICGSHLLVQFAGGIGDWFEAMGRASLTIYIFHVLAMATTRVALTKAHVTAWEPQLMLGTIVGVGLPWLLHLALESADLLAPLGLGVRRRPPPLQLPEDRTRTRRGKTAVTHDRP